MTTIQAERPGRHKRGAGSIRSGPPPLVTVSAGRIGNYFNKRRAVTKAAQGGDGVTVTPFDLITGVRTAKPQGMYGWWGIRILVVTTADGTEYEFRGTMEKWQDHLSDALTARGCGVYPAVDGILVTPPPSGADF